MSSKYSKIHLLSVMTGMTYCGYLPWEGEHTDDISKTTCRQCVHQYEINKPKWKHRRQ